MSQKDVRVFIEVTVKHLDSVPALLVELAEIIRGESDRGMLEKTDGDRFKWETK